MVGSNRLGGLETSGAHQAQETETGRCSAAGTPEQVVDAIKERYRAGVRDVLSLHGFGNPDQEDLLVNGLLPELRRCSIIDTDYIGGDFRSNLELPRCISAKGILSPATPV